MESLVFSSVSGTACALHVVNFQQESIQGLQQGFHVVCLPQNEYCFNRKGRLTALMKNMEQGNVYN